MADLRYGGPESLRLPRTFLRLPKGIFTIEALYYWPLIGNHTMRIQRYHFDLLRWPLLGVLSPLTVWILCISPKLHLLLLFSLFFCNFLSYYCYRFCCIIHKLVEFNAYIVVLRVSCRPIVYYCILLSLRSVKDEIKALITIIITKICPIVNTYPPPDC